MIYLKEDTLAEDTEVITEASPVGKNMYITGPFMMFDKQNRNGRVYPKKIMETAVNEYTTNYINKSRSLGEFGHPAGRVQVDPERACILITELKQDGNYYMGKAKVLSTPLGKVLESLLNDGVKVGVSSRGFGSISNIGSIKQVKDDFRLTAAADVVHDPSVGDAFVESLMEQKEYMVINGIIVEKTLDRLERIKQLKPSKEYQEAVIDQFKAMLRGF